MKGLLTTFGLLLALFSTFQSKADIYDIALSLSPNTSSVNVYTCAQISYSGLQTPLFETTDISSCLENGQNGYKDAYGSPIEHDTCIDSGDALTVISRSCKLLNKSTFVLVAKATFKTSSSLNTCPPSDSPSYSYSFDSNNDGIPEKCYNPFQLDNLSNCATEQGQILNASNSSQLKVCKTDPSSGVSCGYSRPSFDSGGLMLDLEINCFSSDGEVPEYNNDPLPDPLPNCNSVNSQLQVCEADPLDRCRNQYDCDDQCGYVQDKFVCFSGSDQPNTPSETEKDDTDPTETDKPISPDSDISDLMQLTQDKSNGIIYAINQKSNQIINSVDSMHKTVSDKLTLGKKSNSDELQKVQSLLQNLIDKPVGGGGTSPEPTPDPEPEQPAPDAPNFSTDLSDLAPVFDHASIDAEIEQSEQALKDRFFAIRTLFADKFSFNIATGGSLPCLGVIEFGGQSTEICLTPYAEQINWIGLAMVFGFTIFGFIIIFK